MNASAAEEVSDVVSTKTLGRFNGADTWSNNSISSSPSYLSFGFIVQKYASANCITCDYRSHMTCYIVQPTRVITQIYDQFLKAAFIGKPLKRRIDFAQGCSKE